MDPQPRDDEDQDDFSAVLGETPADLRVDGWTGERRIAFLRALWDGASVSEAARVVKMTPQSARRLRLRAPAFRAAWDEAQLFIVEQLADTAFERAIRGSERPVFQRGRLVGHRVQHHDQLLMRLLSIRDPESYAPIDVRERWLRLKAAPPSEGQASDQPSVVPATAGTPGNSGPPPKVQE